MTGPLAGAARATFSSRFGMILTMIGVSVGLGNVWRFPYLVGKFGGAAFVVFYLLASLLIGVPALVAEWTLGRHTRQATLGAFARGGLPGGRLAGKLFFGVIVAATAYYTNVVGWVLYFAVSEVLSIARVTVNAGAILPPEDGFNRTSFLLQLACTAVVILACVTILERGLRQGIERASTLIMPTVFGILLVLIVRSVTLEGAGAGLQWYLGKFAWADLTPTVMAAAMGQAIFSLSLGGTFMVTYGSYLADDAQLLGSAVWTVIGDSTAGLMAGLVIFPAVFAFGLTPSSGPGLLFDTIPRVFAQMPAGNVFGTLFFASLFCAAFLSDVAAFEVLVAGLLDKTGLTRSQAVRRMAALVGVVSIIPMLNLKIFVVWDLTFGSGMQAFGAMLSAITVGWCLNRAALLEQLGPAGGTRQALVLWIRYAIPSVILAVAVWWLLTDVLGVVGTV